MEEHPITKVEIITRPSKLEELKEALNNIGVMGMTVSQVFGCGLQKGYVEVYRGQRYNINLLPGIKVETVVCEVPVDKVVEWLRKSAKQANRAMARFSSTAWTMPSASVLVTVALWPLWTKSKCIKGDSHDDIRFHANPLFLLLRG